MDRPLPNVVQGGSSTGIDTTLPGNPRADKITFRHWDNFKQDRDNGIDKLVKDNPALLFIKSRENATIRLHAEADILGLFHEFINPRLSDIFYELDGVAYRFMAPSKIL